MTVTHPSESTSTIAFTPSGRYRARRCHGSTYLPRETRRELARVTVRGTLFHAFAVRCGEIGYEAALAEVPHDAPHRSLCESVNPLLLPYDWSRVRQEVPFAYDPATDTARELIGVTDRNYAPFIRAGEIPGTIDLLESEPQVVVTVGDLKTGRWSAAYRPQIRSYTLIAARAHRVERGVAQAIYVDENAREARISEEVLDSFDLEEEAAEIRLLLSDLEVSRLRWLESGVPDTHPGDWCTYCDARPHCPEYGAVGRELSDRIDDEPSFLTQMRRELDTPEGLARWWLFLERAPAVLETIRAEVHARAPFPLPDGREVREVVGSERAVTNPALVTAALEAMGWGDAARSALLVEQRMTVGRLVAALGGKKTAQVIIERLIKMGAGVTRAETRSIAAIAAANRRGDADG
jgi:hypothetical protein